MLTGPAPRSGRPRRLLARLLLAVAAVAVAVPFVAATPAYAHHCTPIKVTTSEGTWVYDIEHCHVSQPGDPGGSGGGGGGGAACNPPRGYEFCLGDAYCWANIPSALAESTWPEETRPSPEAIYTYRSCTPDPDGTLSGWSWYEPEGPSLAERAQQAFGTLATPAFSIEFNPPVRAVVGLDTWFWAGTGTTGQITGSEALGVVAIGTPARLEVDPGDGSGVMSCPWTTTESAECSHLYAKASVGQPPGPDGLPSYTARMRLVYDVRFELDGAPLGIAGLPTSLESGWQEVALPVAEIQAIVVR